MLLPSAPQFRKRSEPPRRTAAQSPPALLLAAASYVSGPSVRLSFDRPIDIAALDGSAIVVNDAEDLGLRFRGTGGATLEDPTTVLIVLVEVGDATGTGTTLIAGAGSGILAVNDGGMWAGVAGLALPFP